MIDPARIAETINVVKGVFKLKNAGDAWATSMRRGSWRSDAHHHRDRHAGGFVSVARIAVPDFVSNSYFPAIAAIELGFFAKEGLEVRPRADFPELQGL